MPNYKDFMEMHRCTETEGKWCTHTRIPNPEYNICGGKFSITGADIKQFYKLYADHIFKKKKQEHLTESRIGVTKGPICIDLDFRYSPNVTERPHDITIINDIIDCYCDAIDKLLIVIPNTPFDIFVFEKDDMNDENPEITKDGIHIIIGIKMGWDLQTLLRDRILNGPPYPHLSERIEDALPLENTWEQVVDEGICTGKTNWQLYGSRKPGYDAYKLKHYYIAEKGDEGYEWEEEEFESISNITLLEKVSARRRDLAQFEVRESIKDDIKHMKQIKKQKKAIKRKSNIKICEIKDIVTLDDKIKEFFSSPLPSQYILKETYDYVMALAPAYYTDYDKWRNVGMALHYLGYHNNPDPYPNYIMFLCWMKFSSQKEGFSFDKIEEERKKWKKFKKSNYDNPLTERSIMYWLREKNDDGLKRKEEWDDLQFKTEKALLKQKGRDAFNKIYETTLDYYMDEAISDGTEYSLAMMLRCMFHDSFVCSQMEPKRTWYEYSNNRWRKSERGIGLYKKIGIDIQKKCKDKITIYGNLRHQTLAVENGDTTDATGSENTSSNKYGELMKKATILSRQLKKNVFKESIMKEAAYMFHDSEFIKKLDARQDLLGFKNGVMDFSKQKFREGYKKDYLSFSTGNDYYELDRPAKSKQLENNEKRVIKEINGFMKQLFPDDLLRGYMWEHLASSLTGENLNQLFNVYNGCGGNGKSKLVELMALILGDYATSAVPLSLICGNRPKIGGASPEIAALRGVRYAVMCEPSKGMKLNEGAMKNLTGGDIIKGRSLYKDAIDFRPQCKLVVATNTLFDIASTDNGTWRRIRVIDFISKFVDDPKNKNEFKIDINLDQKFKEWAPIFMSMLIKKRLETGGIVKDVKPVLAAAAAYKAEQDHLSQFIYDKIEKHEGGIIRIQEMYTCFKDWFSENFNGPTPKRKEIEKFLDKELGRRGKKGSKNFNKWIDYKLIDDWDPDKALGNFKV